MNHITSKAALQVAGFCVATLLATGVLVLAGLNERSTTPGGLASIPYETKAPR